VGAGEDIRAGASRVCRSQYVERLFGASDRDGNGRLSKVEAVVSAAAITSALVEARCIASVAASVCFGRHVGQDMAIDQAEYTKVFVPCLLSGLSDKCHAVVCGV